MMDLLPGVTGGVRDALITKSNRSQRVPKDPGLGGLRGFLFFFCFFYEGK